MTWSRSLLFAVAASSCATEDAASDAVCETTATLVDMSQWVLGDSPTDPFPDRPPGMPCTDHGWGLDDGGAFGVYTGECDYVTVSQPLRASLSTCNELVFELTHDRLSAGDGVVAEGYVGLAIDDRLVWEKTVPIPAPPLYEEIRVAIDRDMPAGTPIQFHIHNHGSNGWRLLSLERQVRSDDDGR
jgi:hypothetical protein